jgi:hypothetical protein
MRGAPWVVVAGLFFWLSGCGSGSPPAAEAGGRHDGAAVSADGGADAFPDGEAGSVDAPADARPVVDGGNGVVDGSDAPVLVPGALCGPGGACGQGGCCVAGTCVADGDACGVLPGQCHQGSCGGCGGVGQLCCGGLSCTERATECTQGMCVRCGTEPGERCCKVDPSPTRCLGDDLICGSDGCIRCGQPGTPCCPGSECGGGACCNGRTCVASGASCGTGEGTCNQGHCSACGALDQPCCQFTCEDPFTVCLPVPFTASTHCVACGQPGQPCCAEDRASQCAEGAACVGDHICAACGEAGQFCCDGQTCHGSGCCSMGSCIDAGQTCGEGGTCGGGRCCGRLDGACCPPTSATPVACTDPHTICRGRLPLETCRRCGAPGQPCCPGNSCDGGCCVNGGVDHLCVAVGTSCGDSLVPPYHADGGGDADGDAAADAAGPPPAPICTTTGACGACGGLGQACCPPENQPWCSAAGSTCLRDPDGSLTCHACGNLGQPCCSPFSDGQPEGGTCNAPAACMYSGGVPSCQTPSPGAAPAPFPYDREPVRI